MARVFSQRTPGAPPGSGPPLRLGESVVTITVMQEFVAEHRIQHVGDLMAILGLPASWRPLQVTTTPTHPYGQLSIQFAIKADFSTPWYDEEL